jgi:SAM-dependent MidA family methyltransferase
MNAALPEPDPLARAASQALRNTLIQEITAADGWIPFSDFMECALYEPQLGYYTGGAVKLGPDGDFITAPEISALYGRALANQLQQIMHNSAFEILEVGAGSGRLALQILGELARRESLPEHYRIVEVSGELRARQRQLFEQSAPELAGRIEWLERLPEQFSGAVIGNEVLDAMPVEIVAKTGSGWVRRGVSVDAEGMFAFSDRPAPSDLVQLIAKRIPHSQELEAGYTTELHPIAEGFVATLLARLKKGALLFVDYGFPAAEYYHPQRREGTLMAHYRHRAHTDAFAWPGLQDLTTHVDFSALAGIAEDLGAEVLGYTSQARFLINCGVMELIESQPNDVLKWLPQTNALQRLLSEAEMGELFKVIALGRGLAEPLLGFVRSDRSSTL